METGRGLIVLVILLVFGHCCAQNISFGGIDQNYSACSYLDSKEKVTFCWTANETYLVFAGAVTENVNGNGWFGIGLNASEMVPANASVVSKFGGENATVKLYGLSEKSQAGVVPLDVTWQLIKAEVTNATLVMEVIVPIPYDATSKSQFPLIYAYGEVESGTVLMDHHSNHGSAVVNLTAGTATPVYDGDHDDDDDDDKDGDDKVCFPADAMVFLESGEQVTMENLREGDQVLTTDGSFSEVFFFSHRLPKTHPNKFIQISAEGFSLDLSPSHYVFVNGKLMEARNVKVGDTISVVTEGSFKTAVVSSVSGVVKGGLYNPHTFAGNLVVNSVSVSCYTSTVDPRIAHLLLAPLRMLYSKAGLKPLAGFFHGDRPFLAQLAPSGPSTM